LATRQACIDRGFSTYQAITIANGVDHDIADHPFEKDILDKISNSHNIDFNGKKILITLGRPVKRKGFVWFVRNVMTQLSDDYVFLLVGPRNAKKSMTVKIAELLPDKARHLFEVAFSISSEEWELRQLTAEMDNVIELGKLPFGEVLSLLHASDAFVMPNVKVYGDAEGFGLVALEAVLAETTVIASGIEGITEAIQHEKNGILLTSQDADAWVETIQNQTEDSNLNKEFAKRAKTYTLENFGWEKMSAEYIEYFEKLVEGFR